MRSAALYYFFDEALASKNSRNYDGPRHDTGKAGQ